MTLWLLTVQTFLCVFSPPPIGLRILDKILMRHGVAEDNPGTDIGSIVDLRSAQHTVKAALVSLMRKKVPLLVKEPKDRNFLRNSTFQLNTGYLSSRPKISIPTPTVKISEAVTTAVNSAVLEDRRHAIDAAIVRIMKQRKTIHHQALVMQVSRLCNPLF